MSLGRTGDQPASLCTSGVSGASAPAPAGTSPAEDPGPLPALPHPPGLPGLQGLPARPSQAAPHPEVRRGSQAVPRPEAPRPEARPGSQAAGPAGYEQRASGNASVRVVLCGRGLCAAAGIYTSIYGCINIYLFIYIYFPSYLSITCIYLSTYLSIYLSVYLYSLHVGFTAQPHSSGDISDSGVDAGHGVPRRSPARGWPKVNYPQGIGDAKSQNRAGNGFKTSCPC